MKVYLIALKGNVCPFKLVSWSKVDKVGENGIYVEAVNAFLKKKKQRNGLKKEDMDT